ncbi:hypothetical protein ACSJA2_005097, partial [Escherichia coli]
LFTSFSGSLVSRIPGAVQLPQTNKKDAGGQKTQWNNGISVKKRRSIKDKQRSANNCKSFIPVINFHVLKRIYWWLRHCLMNP